MQQGGHNLCLDHAERSLRSARESISLRRKRSQRNGAVARGEREIHAYIPTLEGWGGEFDVGPWVNTLILALFQCIK